MEWAKSAIVAGCLLLGACLLTACGFHQPHQIKLDEAMPELNVIGDYHHPYYKMVVNRLKSNGVKVNAQNSEFEPDLKQPIPYLMLPQPNVVDETVSVDSRAQAIENSLLITTAATLYIPNHRPILMRNSITRSALNKTGQSLASDVEKATLVDETYQVLADQLVQRLSYLGRYSDPDEISPMPGELVLARGEENDVQYDPRQFEGMTLLEALQIQEQIEQLHSDTVDFEQLNNGQRILNDKSYKLPPVKPVPLHQAPASIY